MSGARMVAAAARLALALSCGACASERAPVDEGFDGNVVIGDARPRRDGASSGDGGLGRADADVEDARADADAEDARADAEVSDAGEDAGPTDAGPSCDPFPVATLTASTALTRAAELAGATVDVVATATVTALECTDRSCPTGDACCNTCSAELSLDGLLPLVAGPCAPVAPGCLGDTCTQVCRPALIGAPETFRGRLLAPAGAAVGLELFLVLP